MSRYLCQRLQPIFHKLVSSEEIQFLDSLFKNAGHEIRIAGGAVRDLLSGVLPHDIDFATTATPEKSKAILECHSNVRLILTKAGERHGTVTARINDKSQFEITTLRCDKITDGRHAEVEFVTDWKIDAERRDLTINAMFLTLDGKLFDYFNGADDLDKGIVRFVGDAERRIQEDYLRIFRYFRFWARYGREDPDPATLGTIQRNLDGLDQISGERIWSELKRIFERLPLDRVVSLMLNLGLLDRVGLHYTGTDWLDAMEELRLIQQRLVQTKFEPILPFASLVRTPEQYQQISDRLRWSNFERDFVRVVVDNRLKESPDLTALKRALALEPKSSRDARLHQMIQYLKYRGESELASELSQWTIPDFPVSGHSLVKKLPTKMRKNMKHILDELKCEWADSDYQMDENDLLVRGDELIEAYKSRAASSPNSPDKIPPNRL